MKRVTLSIEGAQAYSAEDIYTDATLGDLLDLIASAVDEFGADAVVVTRDVRNRYGAMFGAISPVDGIIAVDDDARDEEGF